MGRVVYNQIGKASGAYLKLRDVVSLHSQMAKVSPLTLPGWECHALWDDVRQDQLS